MSFAMDEIVITEAMRFNEVEEVEDVELSIQLDPEDLVRFSVATEEVCIMGLEDFIKLFGRLLEMWRPLQDLRREA